MVTVACIKIYSLPPYNSLLLHLMRVLIFVSGNKTAGDVPVESNDVNRNSADEEVSESQCV